MSRIIASGRLRVIAVAKNHPPFVYKDATGNDAGIDYDIAKTMAQSLGVKLDFKREALNQEELVSLVFKDAYDIGLSSLSTTLTWASMVKFSQPYLTLKQTLISNRLRKAASLNRSPFPIENTNRKTIGVAAGTAYQNYAQKNYTDFYLVPYGNESDMFSDVLAGELRSALTDSLSVQNWFRKNPQHAIYIETEVSSNRVDPIGIAINWKNTHLLSWVNLFLTELNSSGDLDKIVNKHSPQTKKRLSKK